MISEINTILWLTAIGSARKGTKYLVFCGEKPNKSFYFFLICLICDDL